MYHPTVSRCEQLANAGQIGIGSSAGSKPADTAGGPLPGGPWDRRRLFVVCHKAGSRQMLARLFRTWPGFESLELKRDRAMGKRLQL